MADRTVRPDATEELRGIVADQETTFDRDAAEGNRRIARRAFILERMRQEGCLASEAARRFDAGER